MKDKKEIEKKEVKKEAVDPKPETKVEDKPEIIEDLEKQLVELKKKRDELKPKEDRPDIIVEPPCEPKIVFDEKTGVVEAVYSGSCSIKQVQAIAGKIAIEGLRFRPEKAEQLEEKKIWDMTKEERQKDFAEKVAACEKAKTKMEQLGIKPTIKTLLEETAQIETKS